MKRLLFFSLIIFLLTFTACGSEVVDYKNVSTDEAKNFIDNNEVVVLDVRTPEEFHAGHIPNAILIPLQELDNRLNELNKDEKYLVVCQSGNRSSQASEILIKNGFNDIYNMTGGMGSWTFELEK
jgi:rhodanese-related sulfurtransferase